MVCGCAFEGVSWYSFRFFYRFAVCWVNCCVLVGDYALFLGFWGCLLVGKLLAWSLLLGMLAVCFGCGIVYLGFVLVLGFGF